MTKTELVNDMKKFVGGGGFMNQKQLAAYVGKDRHNVAKYTSLCAPVTGKRTYFIGDLADAILHVG